MTTESLPSVLRTETTDDRVVVYLSNGGNARLSHEEARKLSTDPTAALRFLQRWANPRGAK